MIKHLCWFCNKEIISHQEFEKSQFLPGIEIEDVCKECKKELRDVIEKFTEKRMGKV